MHSDKIIHSRGELSSSVRREVYNYFAQKPNVLIGIPELISNCVMGRTPHSVVNLICVVKKEYANFGEIRRVGKKYLFTPKGKK